ncbi:odorant receptor Or2-like [Malaya genurostris]|uniref:odorant receptor Or2-like n=1 Tax=Malaya genurostris TaxID=325434 RepID=UPI0026F3C618|nr:odorant receptor Or2-like [Malaya genurostris]
MLYYEPLAPLQGIDQLGVEVGPVIPELACTDEGFPDEGSSPETDASESRQRIDRRILYDADDIDIVILSDEESRQLQRRSPQRRTFSQHRVSYYTTPEDTRSSAKGIDQEDVAVVPTIPVEARLPVRWRLDDGSFPGIDASETRELFERQAAWFDQSSKMVKQKYLLELENILDKQHIILRMLGLDVYTSGYSFSFLPILFILSLAAFMVFSVTDLYIFRGDTFNFSFVLATFFYGVIGCARIGFALRYPEKAAHALQVAVETYRLTSSNHRELEIFQKYTKRLKRAVVMYSALFVGSSVFAMLLPLVVYLWNGQKMLVFGVIVPFVDPESTEGYEINYMYQISVMLWAIPALTVSQNIYFAMVFNICIQYDMLIVKLEELDVLIKNSDAENTNSTIYRNLVQIINYHQRLINFVLEIEDFYSLQIFIEVSASALQIVLTLFTLNTAIWIPGYLMIVISTFQLLVVCVLGTMIDTRSESFTGGIYNISWRRLPKAQQRLVQFSLANSQKPRLLTYGGVTPLNMNLFLTVYQKIYSVYMMLLNMKK